MAQNKTISVVLLTAAVCKEGMKEEDAGTIVSEHAVCIDDCRDPLLHDWNH